MKKPSLSIKIRNTLFYWGVLFFVKVLRILPRHAAIALLRTFARIAFPLAGRSRKKTIKHLTMAYEKEKSPAEIKALAKNVFLHFFTVTADFIRLPVMIRQGINKFVTVEGIEHLDKAIAANETGIMMLTAHFGNWEILGAWLAQNGYPMRVVGIPLFDPRLDKILVDTRNRAGYTNIARGSGTRGIIRSLREGHPIGMLIDQDTNVQGKFVTFFGRPTHTPTGPLILARKFNVPVVPIFMRLCDDFTYHIECKEPVKLEHTDDEERDLLVNTQKCSDVYEEVIRKHPEQWAWMHKRWKTQPKDIVR
jgi:KDO2-lipid IV(A) lauroyltransferase